MYLYIRLNAFAHLQMLPCTSGSVGTRLLNCISDIELNMNIDFQDVDQNSIITFAMVTELENGQ